MKWGLHSVWRQRPWNLSCSAPGSSRSFPPGQGNGFHCHSWATPACSVSRLSDCPQPAGVAHSKARWQQELELVSSPAPCPKPTHLPASSLPGAAVPWAQKCPEGTERGQGVQAGWAAQGPWEGRAGRASRERERVFWAVSPTWWWALEHCFAPSPASRRKRGQVCSFLTPPAGCNLGQSTGTHVGMSEVGAVQLG